MSIEILSDIQKSRIKTRYEGDFVGAESAFAHLWDLMERYPEISRCRMLLDGNDLYSPDFEQYLFAEKHRGSDLTIFGTEYWCPKYPGVSVKAYWDVFSETRRRFLRKPEDRLTASLVTAFDLRKSPLTIDLMSQIIHEGGLVVAKYAEPAVQLMCDISRKDIYLQIATGKYPVYKQFALIRGYEQDKKDPSVYERLFSPRLF
jgi:hypothetical protein